MERPLSWADLCAFRTAPPSTQLVREPSTQRSYAAYKAQYSSAAAMAEDVNEKLAAQRGSHRWLFSEAPNTVVAENNFPYWCERDVQHLVVWTDSEADFPYVHRVLQETLGADNVVFFHNHTWNKSISALPHCHLFVNSTALAASIFPVSL